MSRTDPRAQVRDSTKGHDRWLRVDVDVFVGVRELANNFLNDNGVLVEILRAAEQPRLVVVGRNVGRKSDGAREGMALDLGAASTNQ